VTRPLPLQRQIVVDAGVGLLTLGRRVRAGGSEEGRQEDEGAKSVHERGWQTRSCAECLEGREQAPERADRIVGQRGIRRRGVLPGHCKTWIALKYGGGPHQR